MRLRGALVLATALAAGALGAEQTVRVMRFGLAGLSYTMLSSMHHLGRSGLVERSRFSEIAYQLRPNQHCLFKLAWFRTNSVGLADDEYPLAKPAGRFRIAVLGSSYSMPAGVRLEDSWHGRLERALNAGGDPDRFEVINFAVGGYDARQVAATFRYRAARYAPDLVLVEANRYSQITMRPEQIYREPFEPRPTVNSFFHSFLLDEIGAPQEQAEPKLAAELSRAAYQRAIGDLVQQAAELRIPLCFVILQHEPWEEASDRPVREALARIAPTTPVIDTARGFGGLPLSSLIIYPGDTHPNGSAHAIFSKVILESLGALGLLPARG